MPNPFKIVSSVSRARIKAEDSAEIEFTVTNTSDEPYQTGVRFNCEGDIQQSWYQTSGGDETDLAPGGSTSCKIAITAPTDPPQSTSNVSVTAYWTKKPSEYFGRSAGVRVDTFTKDPFPWKLIIIIGSAVLVLLIALIIVIYMLPGDPPVADCEPDNAIGVVPPALVVEFKDTSTGEPDKWDWHFGDETTSKEKDPKHTYDKPGVYSGLLQVSRRGTASEVKTFRIEIVERVAAKIGEVPAKVETPARIRFVDESSGDIASRTWSINGKEVGTEATLTHQFSTTKAGGETFEVKLTVVGKSHSEANPNTSSVNASIAVAPKGKASFVYRPSVVLATKEVQFTDQSIGTGKRTWDFGDRSPTTTAKNPKHTFTHKGTYQVKLQIENGDSITRSITVSEPANILSFKAVQLPLPNLLAARNGSRWVFQWQVDNARVVKIDFGDKSPPREMRKGTSAYQYVYATPGNYKATLTVVGDTTTTRTIDVRAIWKPSALPIKTLRRTTPTVIPQPKRR